MSSIRHSGGDKVKKTLLGLVAIAAASSAIYAGPTGTWYTDSASWAAAVTSI